MQAQNSAEGSKKWQRETQSRAKRRTRVKIKPDSDKAETVLRLVYRTILPRILASHVGAEVGIKRPNYETGVSRSHQFMIQLSEELGAKWRELVEANEESSVSDWRKIERRHMEDAALEVVAIVRELPKPVREVVELRASGMGWKAICEELPDRVYFSIIDDWKRALTIFNERHASLLLRFH